MVYAVVMFLSASVCLSVTRNYCIKVVKLRITQTTPIDSPGTLVNYDTKNLCEIQTGMQVG